VDPDRLNRFLRGQRVARLPCQPRRRDPEAGAGVVLFGPRPGQRGSRGPAGQWYPWISPSRRLRHFGQ